MLIDPGGKTARVDGHFLTLTRTNGKDSTMKKSIILILSIVLFGIFAYSQIKVPEKVAAAFKARFPAAVTVEWGKESDTEFEAEFKMNGKEMSANFDATGKWLETETRLSKNDLPAPVLAALKSTFGGSEVKNIESLEEAGKAIVYEVQLEQGEKKLEVILDAGGKIVKQAAVNDEEEEGEESEEND